MRLLFAGTPEVAVPSLRALLDSRHEVVAVLTRPDARAGRGRSLRPSPVAEVAREVGLPVLAPASGRDPALVADVAALDVDCAPVVAYGQLLPRDLLDVPTHGWINLHFSLLPAWRGAAPVQRAIIAGDEMGGASTFVIEEGLDTGPVLGVMTEAIGPRDTAGDLLGRLAVAGAPLLVRTLDAIENGTVQARPQPADGVSYAAKVEADDARVDWRLPAVAIDRLIRGCTPVPGGWSTFRGERIRLGPVEPTLDGLPDGTPLAPGEIVAGKNAVHVGTGTTPVRLGLVRAHGKKEMDAAAWARGVRVDAGERMGEDA